MEKSKTYRKPTKHIYNYYSPDTTWSRLVAMADAAGVSIAEMITRCIEASWADHVADVQEEFAPQQGDDDAINL